jgi:hypothetical protein
LRNTSIDFPINFALLNKITNARQTTGGTQRNHTKNNGSVQLMVARRELGASNKIFTPILNGTTSKVLKDKIRLQQITSLDGEYVVLVSSGADEDQGGALKQSIVSMASANQFTVRSQLGLIVVMLINMLFL